jgi:hypothetical protein
MSGTPTRREIAAVLGGALNPLALAQVFDRYADWELGALHATLAEALEESEPGGWRNRELAATVEGLRLVIAIRELE